MQAGKPRIALHKFSSCDGCQLAFLNAGQQLLSLWEQMNIVHFAEAGPVDSNAKVDISFIEGSISTAADITRIKSVRAQSRILVSIGACATSGGLQALKNGADSDAWLACIYPNPEYIDSLGTATPISAHVKVDLQLQGCPVSTGQILQTVQSLLAGVLPPPEQSRVCLACKRRQLVCVMVTKGLPCMGPVTNNGCDALCPSVGRDCYGCYGPSECANTRALAGQFSALGLTSDQIKHRFSTIHSAAPTFKDAVLDSDHHD